MHIIAYEKKRNMSANLAQTYKSSSPVLGAQSVAAKVLLQTVLLRYQSVILRLLVIVRFSSRIALFFRHKVKTSVDHPQFQLLMTQVALI